MKRFLTLVAAIMMVVAAMAQSAGIMLSTKDGKELKFFKSDRLVDAIEEADANDTIYFGPGKFDLSCLPRYEASTSSSDRVINKPLVFIGAGGYGDTESTQFAGIKDLYLNADGISDDSKKNFSFEGIYFNSNYNTIRPASNLNELKYVNFNGNVSETDSENEWVIKELIIDRCHVPYLTLSNFKTLNVKVNNTRISQELRGGSDSAHGVATFDHCYINTIKDNFAGLIEHSLIYYTYAGNLSSLKDCRYYHDSGESAKDGCQKLSSSSVSALDEDPSSLGNCNDNTSYGTSGGTTPFTLNPQYPTPDTSVDSETKKSNSFVDYDNVNKKLTITVKRLGN